jgi:tyrosine-protein kinase Etk/Wzc
VNALTNREIAISTNTEEEEVVLGRLLRAMLDDIWWLIGVAVLIILIAGTYCYFAKPIYTANALVRVEQSDDSSELLMQKLGGSVGARMGPLPTDAEIGIMQSRNVVEPVVRKYKLNFSVRPKMIPLLGGLAANFATPGRPARPWFGASSYAWGGEQIDVDSIEVVPAFEGKVLMLTVLGDGKYEVHGPDDTLLLRGSVGQRAEGGGVTIFVGRLVARPGTQFNVVRANELDALARFQSIIRVEEQGKQTGLIDIALDNEDSQLAADITNELARSYLREHVETRQTSASNMLDFLKSEEPRLKNELTLAAAALADYQRQSGSINASEESKAYLQGSIQYEQQISALQLQIAVLMERYGDQHPLIATAQQQMSDLKAQRDKYDSRFRDLPAAEAKAVELQRDAKVAEDIYELVLTREQELSVQKAGSGGNVHIVDEALRPGRAAKPKKLLIMSAATILGLVLGTGVVFLRYTMFKGIDDPDYIERVFQLPIFGLVPLSAEQAALERKGERAGSAASPILAEERSDDACIESLRSVRTSMQFSLMTAQNRIVMLCGPLSAVGKSFLTVNLAVLLARSGKHVLVIDGDMRRGGLEHYWGGGQENGLSEVLSGQTSLEAVIRSTTVAGLSFVASGRRPPNPSELLMSPRLAQCFEILAERYDVILIDTPPVLAVTDASIIGAHAGSSLFVMRAGMHSNAEIAESLKRLKASGIKVNGGVFNGGRQRTTSYYGNYTTREQVGA